MQMGMLAARTLAILAAVGAVASTAGAQSQDIKEELAALRKEVAELKAAQASQAKGAEAVRAEEIRKVVKEMSVDAAKDSSDWSLAWKDGLWMGTKDNSFAFHVGGQFGMDWGWDHGGNLEKKIGTNAANPPPTTEFRDGVEFRTVRLKAEGTMYKYIQFKIEEDFANDTVVLKDAYVRMTQIPVVGNVQVGNFKEPFSMEELSGDIVTFFMERGLPNVFAPSRNPGMMAYNAFLGEPKKERMTAAIGMFRQEQIGDLWTGSAADGTMVNSQRGYAVTGRITGLPWYENKGAQLLHLGSAYSYRSTNDTATVEYRARPEAHFTNYRLIDTGVINNVEDVSLWNAELAGVCGPFAVQSEVTAAWLSMGDHPNQVNATESRVGYCGWYTQGSYMITGESRPYNHTSGTFDRIRPKKNFREDGGWGAWEVAARYSYLNLDDEKLGNLATNPPNGTSQGEMNDVTMGLNWYLNPNTRVQWNYIYAVPHRLNNTADGDSIFMMRFFFDF